MPVPKYIEKLRRLLGGLSYYRKFLPKTPKQTHSIVALLKKGAVFDFTPEMDAIVRDLLTDITSPPVPVFSDWDTVEARLCPFLLYCDASTDGLDATLEQAQPDGSIRPIVYLAVPHSPMINSRLSLSWKLVAWSWTSAVYAATCSICPSASTPTIRASS